MTIHGMSNYNYIGQIYIAQNHKYKSKKLSISKDSNHIPPKNVFWITRNMWRRI